jgi:hypothetical protein
LQAAACCDAIQRFATEPDRTARRANLASTRVVATRYSDRDIVLAVQFLADRLQRAPSAKDYAPLGREPGFPSLATVINRMDGWSNALGAAGLAPVSGPVAGRSRRWTAEVCRAALFDVVGELGEIPTIAGYDRHACNRDDLPSSATIRIRLGRWSAITTQIANERETFAARAEEALLLRPPLTSAAKTPRGCPGYPLPYPGGREAPV